LGDQHSQLGIEVHPTVAQRGVQAAHPGNVVCHVSHLRALWVWSHRPSRHRHPCPSSPDRPSHLASHTSAVSLALGALPALLLLIVPGSLVGIAARLPWPVAVSVGPALTYGVVGVSIIPLGAIGWPWNAWMALFALALVTAVVIGLRLVLSRYRDRDAEAL